MVARHSFWSVLGPVEAPPFGAGPRAARGGANPLRDASVDASEQARIAELVVILGEANRVTNRCRRIFAGVHADTGLSGIETLTLMAITHAAKPPTVPQVGRSLGHPRQVIQRAVRVLEQAGFVQPQPNPGHKRAALLVTTDAGLQLGRKIDGQAAEIIAGLSCGLDIDLAGLAAIGEGLLALRDRMDEDPQVGD